MIQRRMLALLSGALFGLSACLGALDDAPPPATVSEPRTGPDGGPEHEPCEEVVPATLRRLSASQYRNSVLDILHVPSLPGTVLDRLNGIAEDRAGRFVTNVLAVDETATAAYLDNAVELAVVSRENRARFAGEDCDASDRACARKTLEGLTELAFRGRSSPSMIEGYLRDYDAALSADASAEEAFDLALASVWNSPNFLYRAEETKGDGSATVDDLALAARLAALLWDSTPDRPLLDRARAGDLATDLADVVEEMMNDARFDRSQRLFFQALLGVDDSLELPGLDDDLREAIILESYAFIDHVMTEDDGSLATLLTANYTVGDSRLAEHYQADSPAGGYGRIELPSERRGLLTHAGVLAAHGSHFPEVHRALFLRDTFLCDPVPLFTEVPPDEGAEFRLTNSECAACHRFMDPLGFAYTEFDNVGRYSASTVEDWESLPAQPELIALRPDSDVEGVVASPAELAGRLADSEQVRACFTQHWLSYAFGTKGAGASDACAGETLTDSFRRSNGDVLELIRETLSNEAFARRARSGFGG